MNIEEPRLWELLEESQDIQSDAMKRAETDLKGLVEVSHETQDQEVNDPEAIAAFSESRRDLMRRATLGAGALGATGLGAALLGVFSTPAFASSGTDVQILQTAASIENLAVATYQTALTLPFIGGSSANPVVKAFAQTTMSQHTQHAAAFNAAITSLGGKAQMQPDPVLLQVVEKAKPGLTGPAQVVALALQLEEGAAETYVANVAALKQAHARDVTASIMGVEAQHVAILLAVQALLAGGAAQDITLPPPVASLPGAAGSVGFPNAFYQTSQARPATEGAVK